MTIAQEGRQEGRWVGKILNLEELMGIAPTDAQALASLTIPELERRYAQLRRESDSRFRRYQDPPPRRSKIQDAREEQI